MRIWMAHQFICFLDVLYMYVDDMCVYITCLNTCHIHTWMTHHHSVARSMLPPSKTNLRSTCQPKFLSSFHPNHGYELQKLRSQKPEAYWCETAQKWLANPTQGSKPNDLTAVMGSKQLESWSHMGEPPGRLEEILETWYLGFIRQSSPF